MARSDMTHMSMCMLSGISETKSQNVSCADAACGIAAVRLHLHGVDEVGELDGVLDEEDRDVVADEIEVALLGVELDREAAHVARRVDRAGAAGDGREPHEHLGLLLRVLQERRPRSASDIDLYGWKKPCAPEPRAWTMRSGMRSWSKWVIFSRRMKSSSRVGPRAPLLSEFWLSAIGAPWLVVKHAVRGGDGLVGFAAFSGAQRRGFRVGGRSPGRRLGHGRNSDVRKDEGRRRHEARTTT